MYLLGMLFHPVNVSSLTFALEVKSCSALCAKLPKNLGKLQLSFQKAQHVEQEANKCVENGNQTFAG